MMAYYSPQLIMYILQVVTEFTQVCVIHEPAIWRRSLERVVVLALCRLSEVRSNE